MHYQYDATGQVSGITVHDLNGDVYSNNNIGSTRVLATDITRLPFGPITGLNYSNGFALSRSYNLDYARTGQTVGNLQNLTYSHDLVGNLQTSNDLLAPGNNQHYSYDPLRRLTEVSGSNDWSYSYDAVGNRTAEQQGTAETLYHYALDSQKLLTQTGARPDTLQSNALGNLTQAGGKSYGYWPDQQLLSVRQGITNIAAYEYDAQGQRRVKRSFAGSGSRTYFDYDPQGRLIGEMGGNTWGNYVYLDGEPLARIDSAFSDAEGYIGNGNVVYFHNNLVGAPLATTDRLGQLSWTAQMGPFGEVRPINTSITQNLRFPGQYYDQETGLYYNMHRYYDPNTGRYLQSDPIGLAGSINTYTYVRNNPVNRIDPLGLYDTLNCSVSQCAQIADAVAAAQNAANQQGIGNEVSKTLDNTTFQCRKPDKAKNYCAANNDPTIYLRNAFNAKKCGPLESTVLHEVSHSAPLNYSEMDAFLLENKAFGTSIPTPEQLQSDYPNLSPEQIQYYRNQTNGLIK